MFSTSGYFKGLTCPYFAGGLCERPYCHFRHVKPAEEKTGGDGCANATNAGTTSKPSLLNMVGDAIRQVQRDIEKDKARLSAPASGPVVYNPTPLAHCSTAPKPPPSQETALKRVTIPQYKPTPIKLLKKQQTTQQLKRAHSELEYDPATNFSTSTKTNLGETVGEPKGKYPKTAKTTVLSDSDIEATFSDEDDVVIVSNQRELANEGIKKGTDSSKKDSLSNKEPKIRSKTSTVKVKEEPDETKSEVAKKSAIKDPRNIFDLVRVKTEKSDEEVSVKAEKCDANSVKTEKCDERSVKTEKAEVSIKTEKCGPKVVKTEKAVVKVERSNNGDEKSSSHIEHKKSESSHRRSHSSDKGKDRRSSHEGKHHSQEKKRRSSHNSGKSDDSGKDKDKSSHKHRSSESHHRSSSSSHKSSPRRKHHNSTSSQESGSKSKRGHSHDDKSKKHKKNERKESTDSRSSDKAKNLNFKSLFGQDSDNDIIVLSDEEKKDTVELSSEEEVLDLEALFEDEESRSPEKDEDTEEIEAKPVNKKRVAHAAASSNTAAKKRSSLDLPKARPSPAEVLYNRMKEMKRRADEQAQKVQEGKVTSTSSIGSDKKRLAHSSPFSNKKSKLAPADSSTQAKTADKGGKRVAHMPAKVALVRPIIPPDKNSKVPVNVRQRYLNTFIDESLKIYSDEQDAFDRGLEEEKQVYARSGTKVVYLNNAVNTIKKLRNEAKSGPSADNLSPVAKVKIEKSITSPKKGSSPKAGTPSPKKNMFLSHELMLGGKKGLQSNFTVKRSGKHVPVPDKFTGSELYKYLQPYILNEEQLFDNGFPRPDDETPGSAIINVPNDSDKIAPKANERICRHCGKRFVITEDGKCVNQEQCVHHWGKAFKRKIAGQWDHRYTCCQSDLTGKGCQIGQRHVHDQNKYDDFHGYVQTQPCPSKSDGNYGIYALDCEMVYTEGGFELARVTVIDENCEVTLETKVIPDYPIVDYNSRFSGLTEDDMAGVTTTIRDVQMMLLDMFSDKTILIGHSLESDFIALKLIHDTVVDTSVAFPHKLGPPYKKALRTLMADYMQKIIQNDEDGHDSKEDAVSCMELMLWKVKEDAKKAMRRT